MDVLDSLDLLNLPAIQYNAVTKTTATVALNINVPVRMHLVARWWNDVMVERTNLSNNTIHTKLFYEIPAKLWDQNKRFVGPIIAARLVQQEI